MSTIFQTIDAEIMALLNLSPEDAAKEIAAMPEYDPIWDDIFDIGYAINNPLPQQTITVTITGVNQYIPKNFDKYKIISTNKYITTSDIYEYSYYCGAA